MKRSLTLWILFLPLMLSGLAEARARRPARRTSKPKPKLLLTVDKVEAKTPMPQLLPRLRAALNEALAAEPLVITTLGLKKPTAVRTAWTLRRRRLRWFGVTARLESVTYKVVGKKPKLLVANAVVSLTGTRKERRRKGSFAVRATGKISTPVSVVLQGEVLASRIAATRTAMVGALKNAVTHLTAPKKRRPRR